MSEPPSGPHAVVIGAGFTGLAIAYDLAGAGFRVTVLERQGEAGGIAAGFEIDGVRLDQFYHYWYVGNTVVHDFAREVGGGDDIVVRATRTDLFHNGRFYRLSTPMDVLRFRPLGFLDRIRLGLMVLKAQRVKDWQYLETITAERWLTELGSEAVYKTVWEPLMRGKFGPHAPEIAAVWFWHRLKLRGSTRGKSGAEAIAGYRRGFWSLVDKIVAAIEARGGTIELGAPVDRLIVQDGRIAGVGVGDREIPCDYVVATPALPIIADLVEPHVDAAYADSLRQIRYLANVCFAMFTDRELCDTFWLNVGDPDIPFVGVIGHTNFEPPESYQGNHVWYLTSYVPETDALYQMNADEVFEHAVPYLRRMFPDFQPEWVKAYKVSKARYAQPVCVCNYPALIPAEETPIQGLRICTMAQIYPQDRGTNYAVEYGRATARRLIEQAGAASASGPQPPR